MQNNKRFRIAILVFAVMLISNTSISHASPPNARVEVSSRRGFDTCQNPNYSQLVQIGNNSDFWSYGVYIGGINASCPMKDSALISQATGYGWGFIPLYVGRQSACGGFNDPNIVLIAPDVSTAQSQANTDATDAEAKATNLGFTVGSILYLDVEGYTITSTQCHTSTKAYIAQWIKKLHNDGWQTGAYGSACISYVSEWSAFVPAPDDVFMREVYTNPTVANTDVFNRSCVSNSYWASNQRHHQYYVTYTAKAYGSYTLRSRDENCSQGLVAATGYNDGVLNTCP